MAYCKWNWNAKWRNCAWHWHWDWDCDLVNRWRSSWPSYAYFDAIASHAVGQQLNHHHVGISHTLCALSFYPHKPLMCVCVCVSDALTCHFTRHLQVPLMATTIKTFAKISLEKGASIRSLTRSLPSSLPLCSKGIIMPYAICWLCAVAVAGAEAEGAPHAFKLAPSTAA